MRNIALYSVCTVTFGQKVPKLNSRPVYCSQLYGSLNYMIKQSSIVWKIAERTNNFQVYAVLNIHNFGVFTAARVNVISD